MMQEYQLDYLFSETLVSQTVANTISEQTGASILYIYSMGNIAKEEFDAGLTLLEMLEHNLIQYRIGLGYDETDHTH
jgi:ABC-type Zn uptake system ZnuABC Zn-binding protein ZnuA